MRRASIIAVAVVAIGVAPAATRAQVGRDCVPTQVLNLTDADIGSAWLAHHPGRLFTRLQPLIDAGSWAAVMDSVVASSREALQRSAPAEHVDRYLAELAEADRLFEKALTFSGDAQSRFFADSVRPTRWQLTQGPTGAVPVFAGPNAISVTSAMASDQRRALCWPAIAVNRLLTQYRAGSREETVRRFEELATRWDSYVDHSFSMYPWELLLNGLTQARRGWEPPTRQWILFHPSVGIEVAGLRRRQLNRVDAMVFEGLGFLKYNEDYTRYVGVSGVATFASDRSMALGGYVHLWFPQAKLGYVVRPDSVGKRERSVLLSMDLYKFLTGVPRTLQEAKEQALKRRQEEGTPP